MLMNIFRIFAKDEKCTRPNIWYLVFGLFTFSKCRAPNTASELLQGLLDLDHPAVWSLKRYGSFAGLER